MGNDNFPITLANMFGFRLTQPKTTKKKLKTSLQAQACCHLQAPDHQATGAEAPLDFLSQKGWGCHDMLLYAITKT